MLRKSVLKRLNYGAGTAGPAKIERFSALANASPHLPRNGETQWRVDSEHDNLVATTLDLQKKFHAGEPEVTADTAAYLVSWLTNHIPNIDKLYGPFLNEKGVA